MQTPLKPEEIKVANQQIHNLSPLQDIPFRNLFPYIICCRGKKIKVSLKKEKMLDRNSMRENTVEENQEKVKNIMLD